MSPQHLHLSSSLAVLAFLAPVLAQEPVEVVTAEATISLALEDALIRELTWRNIGNANQKGRISDIDAVEDNFAHVIVGTASGGVWKSVNAGTTWEPIFENYGSASVGDVALFQPDPNIVWGWRMMRSTSSSSNTW